MGDPVAPKPPQLPPGAPDDLRRFLKCDPGASATLKNGKLTWLQLPPEIKDFVPQDAKPNLSIQPGSKPGTAIIKIGLGPIGVSFPASISGGQLNVDTSNPGMLTPQPLVDGINQAVKDINAWFKHHGKGFAPPVFGNGQVTLAKVDLPKGTAKDALSVTPTPPPPPKPTPPKPTPPPEPPAPVVPQVAGTDWGHIAPTAEQWDKALAESKAESPPPPPSKPVVGVGGPGGPKAPVGLGDLAVRVFLLGIVAAVVGGVIFVGGPALGLFGAANPIPTSSSTASSTASASAPPPPIPAPRTVTSDDGLWVLTIPDGAAPADAHITITVLGQAAAPPELEGVNFRSGFLRITPADLTLFGPVVITRIVDLTAQGTNPDQVGYPVIWLAQRTTDGKWSWLSNQSTWIGGTDGTAPKTQVIQQATLDRFGDIFGFGGTVWVHPDPPYKADASDFFNSGSLNHNLKFGATFTGASLAPFDPGELPTITDLFGYASIPDLVDVSALTGLAAPGVPSVDIGVTCREPGDLVVGIDASVAQSYSSELLVQLGLGAPPNEELRARWALRCHELSGYMASVKSGCVEVIHEPLGKDPSYTRAKVDFGLDSLFPPDPTLQLSFREGASGPLLTFADFPIVGFSAMADTGITEYGDKLWGDIFVNGSDGSMTNITDSWNSVFGDSVTVTSSEGAIGGNACE